jgi:hypothetical protein
MRSEYVSVDAKQSFAQRFLSGHTEAIRNMHDKKRIRVATEEDKKIVRHFV